MSKYTPERTKLHHFLNFSRKSMSPDPVAMCSAMGRATSLKWDVLQHASPPMFSKLYPPCLNVDLRVELIYVTFLVYTIVTRQVVRSHFDGEVFLHSDNTTYMYICKLHSKEYTLCYNCASQYPDCEFPLHLL